MKKHRLIQMLEMVPNDAEVVIRCYAMGVQLESDFQVSMFLDKEGSIVQLVPEEAIEIYDEEGNTLRPHN